MSKTLGRPPRFREAQEMQVLIDAYFLACEGHPLIDDKGGIVTDRQGRTIIVGAEPPTISGLALALGFMSRSALLYYQGKREFMEVVTRAKARVEKYVETRLFDRDGVNGAKFMLACSFKGWRDNDPTDISAPQDDPLTKSLLQIGKGT